MLFKKKDSEKKIRPPTFIQIGEESFVHVDEVVIAERWHYYDGTPCLRITKRSSNNGTCDRYVWADEEWARDVIAALKSLCKWRFE